MVGACNSAVDRRLGGVPYSSSSYDRVNVQRWRDESANATGMGGWADGRRGYRGGRGRRPDHQQSSFQHGGVKKRGVRGGSEQRAVPLMCDSRRAWAVLRSSREGEQAGPTFLRQGMVPSLCATVPQLIVRWNARIRPVPKCALADLAVPDGPRARWWLGGRQLGRSCGQHRWLQREGRRDCCRSTIDGRPTLSTCSQSRRRGRTSAAWSTGCMGHRRALTSICCPSICCPSVK